MHRILAHNLKGTANMNDETMIDDSGMDIDDILDITLDEIADLPEFLLPPIGSYGLTLKAIEKKSGVGKEKDKKVIEFRYAIREVLELADPDKVSTIKVGDLFSEAFFLPDGLEYAKKHFVVLGESFGLTRVVDIIEAAKDIDVFATISHRINKKDTSQVYARVTNLLVA